MNVFEDEVISFALNECGILWGENTRQFIYVELPNHAKSEIIPETATLDDYHRVLQKFVQFVLDEFSHFRGAPIYELRLKLLNTAYSKKTSFGYNYKMAMIYLDDMIKLVMNEDPAYSRLKNIILIQMPELLEMMGIDPIE